MAQFIPPSSLKKIIMKKSIKLSSLITLFLLTGSLFFISCSTNNSTEADNKSMAVKVNQQQERPYQISENEAANVKLVTEYIEAILDGNGGKVKSLVNEGFMERGPSAQDSMTVDEAIAFWGNVKKTDSDQKSGILAASSFTVNQGNLKGEWAHLWGTYTAIDKKTKEAVTIPWHSGFFIENNKISMRGSYWDNLSISLQLGQVAPVE